MIPTRFSVATASGKAAIATVIVVGEDALRIAEKVFRPLNRKVKIGVAHDRILYGNWIDEGQSGEDLIVCTHSPTQFEIHCHGSIAALEIITRTLVQHGAVQIAPNEMTCLLAGGDYFGDLNRTATLASTARTAVLLLKQPALHRTFWTEISENVGKRQTGPAVEMLDEFLQWTGFGLHLTQPYKVVICGKPNVGKSSLINAMLGFQRAIVHDVAGTTRDAVSEMTAIDGWPVELVDTAGIRMSSDAVEQQGVAIARESLVAADLRLLVVDLSETDSQSIVEQVEMHQPHLVIGNKSDLAEADFEQISLPVSATEKVNLEELIQLIANRLVPKVPESSQAVPVSDYCVQLAKELRGLIAEADFEAAQQKIAVIQG